MPLDNTVIQIKYSTANGKPASLNVGELGYSFVSNTLFVGTFSNAVINIGGVAMAHHIENRSTTALPDTLVLRDNSGGIVANNIYGNLIGGSNTSQQFFQKRYINVAGDVVSTSNLYDGTTNADITLIEPMEGDTLLFGEELHAEGTIGGDGELHGYSLNMINQTTGETLLSKASSDHAETYSFHEHWVNSVTDTSNVKIIVEVELNHDGDKTSK